MVTVRIEKTAPTGAKTIVKVTAESVERALKLCPGRVLFPINPYEFFGRD